MSSPEWYDEAPPVGDFLGPKGEVMFLFPGSGQLNLFGLKGWMVFEIVLFVYFNVKIDMKISARVMIENNLKKELYIEIPFWYSPFLFFVIISCLLKIVNMVEITLLEFTYLLFYGLVGLSIINVALVIIIMRLLHRQ